MCDCRCSTALIAHRRTFSHHMLWVRWVWHIRNLENTTCWCLFNYTFGFHLPIAFLKRAMVLSDCCQVCSIIFLRWILLWWSYRPPSPSIVEVGIVLKLLLGLSSAFSLPFIPACPGVHWNLTVFISPISANSFCISVNMGFDFGYMEWPGGSWVNRKRSFISLQLPF
jgi:hypothetical protein